MGRGAGCCNFKYTVNCTAPPCPEGTCCSVDTTKTTSNSITLEDNLERYICEDNVTENCCLTKQHSFFNKGATCGEFEACDGESFVTLPMVASTDKAFALLKHDGSVVTWGAFSMSRSNKLAGHFPIKAQDHTLKSTGENTYKNIVDIVANKNAFLFLDKDGWYTTLGDTLFGGINNTTFSSPNYVDEYNFGCEQNAAQDCFTSEQIPVPRSRLKKGSIVPINTGLKYKRSIRKEEDEEEISFTYSRQNSEVSRGGFAGISLEGKLVIYYSDLFLPTNTQPENLTPPFVLTFGGAFGIFNHSMELELPDEVKDKTDIVEVASFGHYVAVRDSSNKIFILQLPIVQGFFGQSSNRVKMAGDRRDVNRDGRISSSDLTSIKRLSLRTYSSRGDVNKDGTYTSSDLLEMVDTVSRLQFGDPDYDSGFTDVKKIYSNRFAFAFLKNDGTVFTWSEARDDGRGGNTGSRQSLLTNVKEIYNTDSAFLAHRTDNKIVVWGDINTTASPDSDFYSEVLDVFPSKNAFGISYITQKDGEILDNITTLEHFFDILGDVVRNEETEAQRVDLRPSQNSRVRNYTGDRKVGNTSTKVHLGTVFLNLGTYIPPYDHENPPLRSGGGVVKFERDFYASDYAFHFASRNVYGAQSLENFYLIGQSPLVHLGYDDQHYAHKIQVEPHGAADAPGAPEGYGLTEKKGGAVRDIIRRENALVDAPTQYSNNTETLEKALIRGAKNYVFNRKATAFLVDGFHPSFQAASREFGSPNLGREFVVSLGHADYGGIGSSFLPAFDPFTGKPTYPNSTSRFINQIAFPDPEIFNRFRDYVPAQRGSFVGLYSNRHAFCGVRIDNNGSSPLAEYHPDGYIYETNQDGKISFGGGSFATYEIFTWGDDDFGGNAGGVDFSNVFANTKDLKITYKGCNPKYCDQDI